MAKIYFVDDRPEEVLRQWHLSGCACNHELGPVTIFETVRQTVEMVKAFEPNIILIGYGLGKYPVTGADVVRALRENGFTGRIIANSGGGAELFTQAGVEVDGTANRNAVDLRKITEE